MRGGRGDRRHAEQEREAGGGVAPQTQNTRPMMIVAPDRDTPGTSAATARRRPERLPGT